MQHKGDDKGKVKIIIENGVGSRGGPIQWKVRALGRIMMMIRLNYEGTYTPDC